MEVLLLSPHIFFDEMILNIFLPKESDEDEDEDKEEHEIFSNPSESPSVNDDTKNSSPYSSTTFVSQTTHITSNTHGNNFYPNPGLQVFNFVQIIS